MQAEQRIRFNIAAQNLSSALLQFSEQSGVKIFFTTQTTRAIKSKALMGLYTAEQALDTLLENSGIQYRFTATQSVTLSLQRSEIKTEPLLALEPAMVVYGSVTDVNRPVDQVSAKASGQTWNGYHVFSASTATRVNTPMMELAQSIQVIPRALIDDQQALTVTESLRNISGVVPRTPGITPNFEPTLIRGFSAMQMIDGFYQNLNTGDQGSLVNIQQIEVIKGANATLYSGGGGSPSGGVINLLSKLPEKEAFYEFGLKGGNYQFVQPYVDINQPINESLLLRFTGEYSHSKSHVEVLQTERYNLNPSLTWTNNKSSSLTLQGKYSKWQQQDYQGLPATGTVAGDFTLDPRLYIGPADIGDSVSELGSVWGTFKHQFNDSWAMTAKARYAYSLHDTITQGIIGEGFDFSADKPLSAEDLALLGSPALKHTWGLSNNELYQQSDEMTFQLYSTVYFDFEASHHALIIGGDFSEHDEAGFIEFNALLIGLVDLTQPVFLPYEYPGTRENKQFTRNTTYGGYMQLQSTLYEHLHLLAGFRAGNVSSDYKNTTPGFEFSSDASTTRVLPNVGAVIDLGDEYAFFVNYNQGMRAQSGVNFVSTPKPELSDQLEFGLKFDIAEQLTGQLALYQINKKNMAITDFSDPQLRATTGGQQRSRGVESNISWQLSDGFKLLATYAFTDARFSDSLIVAKGNQVPGVPEHAGRLWLNYAFQEALLSGLSIGAGIYAQSSAYLENKNLFKSDAFYTMDATIAYARNNYKLGISVKNLSDVNYYQRLNYFATRTMPAQGTEVFFSGTVTF
ncbi:MAG: TonB-dependent siderophore receptor [Methyloprofundus sp.]|nr:TonB-dependent siderophore receptor [Methyloprofundus sp.]